MATYILTWNPDRWKWDDVDQEVQRNQKGQPIECRWSIGNRTHLQPSSRVFLLRQSTQRGLIAAGYSTGFPFKDRHWDETRDDDANYVDCRFETLLHPDQVFPVEELMAANMDVPWEGMQVSGVQVPDVHAARLEEMWREHLGRIGRSSRAYFRVGHFYTRQDIYEVLQVPEDQRGGDWDTGYHRHNDRWFIFAGVGIGGRTGHDYGNHWAGNVLVWRGKTGSRLRHQSIRSMLDGSHEVLVFTRSQDRSPFEFQGHAHAVDTVDTVPVTVHWHFDREPQHRPTELPEEVAEPAKLWEGATRLISVNAYERNPEARRRCIEHYGWNCQACGFNFREVYGELGDDYIHVHHLRDLSTIGEEYAVDPIHDLRPICPNCHAMLHRQRPALSVEELIAVLKRKHD